MKPLVSVVMITYGHEQFIGNAIKGVFNQQTNFPIELIIANDNSPDKTDDIVKKIIVQAPSHISVKYTCHKVNKGMMPNFHWALEQGEGIYIAMCEGDDYWIDPLKLQKQVDIMQANPSVSLVSTGYTTSNDEINIFIKSNERPYFEFNINDWTKTWFTKTLTTLFRKDCITEYLDNIKRYEFGRDIHLFYHLLKRGNGIYLQESTGVYNIHAGGICSMIDPKTNAVNTYNCWKEIHSYNNDQVSQKMLFFSILKLLRTGHKTSYIAEGIKYIPNSVGYLRLFYSFIKGRLVKFNS